MKKNKESVSEAMDRSISTTMKSVSIKQVIFLLMVFVLLLAAIAPVSVDAKTKSGIVGGAFYYQGAKYELSVDDEYDGGTTRILKNRKKIGVIPGYYDSITLVYGKYLYASSFQSFCIYNMKTEEAKIIPTEAGLGVHERGSGDWSPYHYKQYYMMTCSSADWFYFGCYILDAKKGKLMTMAKAGSPVVCNGKKVYYIAADKKGENFKLYSCKVNGKSKKLLTTLKKSKHYKGGIIVQPTIEKMTKSYLTISNYDYLGYIETVYRYDLKTGKLQKMKEEKG